MLSINQLKTLRLGRYEFFLRAQNETVLPPFLGTTLRGAFGHALKAVACSMPHGDCKRCLLVERCLYPRVFETSAQNANRLFAHGESAPRPFIFNPPMPDADSRLLQARDDLLRWRLGVRAGGVITFGLSLLGNAIEDLPYIIYASSLMAKHGLGAERASFALEMVRALDSNGNRQTIYSPELTRIRGHEESTATLADLVQVRLAEVLAARTGQLAIAAGATQKGNPVLMNGVSALKDEIALRFTTPTRIRVKGELIEHPSFTQFVSGLCQRLSLLSQVHGDQSLDYDRKGLLQCASQIRPVKSTLRLISLDRFSNRRHGKLRLDGFVGEVTLKGPDIDDLLPILVAGEFVHMGSGTAFGLGKYMII